MDAPARFLLDHLAVAVPEVGAVAEILVSVWGGRALEGGRGVDFDFWQWRFREGERIEAIVPRGPEGFLHRFLARHGPGVHHVTFKVPRLADAVARVHRFGLGVVGHDESNPGWKEAFLHPKDAHGIVVQLAESAPAQDGTLDPDWRFPPTSSPTPAPARILALVLSMRDTTAARRQWAELLGGRAEETGAGLRFRWPDSPLAVEVEIDARAPEGPHALVVEGRAAPDAPAVLGVEVRPPC